MEKIKFILGKFSFPFFLQPTVSKQIYIIIYYNKLLSICFCPDLNSF
jgi:hypothetical protein